MHAPVGGRAHHASSSMLMQSSSNTVGTTVVGSSRRSFSTPASEFPRPPSGDIDVTDVVAAAPPSSISATSKYSQRLRGRVQGAAAPPPEQSQPQGGGTPPPPQQHHHARERADSGSWNTAPATGPSNEYVDRLLGFQNLGNTCFMNATLQCLLRARLLRRFFMQVDMDRDVPRDAPLTTALRDVARRVFSSPSTATAGGHGTLAPSSFKQCLSSYKRAFAGFEQHDAHEFLRFALDGIHEECNRVTQKVPYEELKDIEGEAPAATADRWLANHNRRNKSIVQDVFQGQYFSTVRCHRCNTVCSSGEIFLDMSLQMPASNKSSILSGGRSGSINESLNEYFSDVRLAGDDAFRCPKCKSMQEATRKTSLFRLPDVLVVHLKRFRHSRFHASKINDAVDFPVDTDLNLTAYCHAESPVITTAAATAPPKYRLTGVVHHMGSVHGGHYIAHCQATGSSAYASSLESSNNGGGGNPNSNWYEFDDSSVSQLRRKDQLTAGTAYILFYERVGGGGSSKL